MTNTASYQEADAIKIHEAEGFTGMRAAGKLAAQALDMLTPHVVPGIATKKLDDLLYDFACDHGAVPAPLNYRGFPASLCVSINHVVCHGIPGDRIVKSGDCVNLDVTLIKDGWHGDTSRMFLCGEVSKKASRLVDTTYAAMMAGIATIKPGSTVGDIGAAIQELAHKERFSVVRDFCGHGIGRVFHDAPNIVHAGQKGQGVVLREGMFFTVEPMINAGRLAVKILQDGWTAVTRDKSLSAQFEHTVGVTKDGAEIFTRSPLGWHCPPYDTV